MAEQVYLNAEKPSEALRILLMRALAMPLPYDEHAVSLKAGETLEKELAELDELRKGAGKEGGS